jgi:hypothetical protein
MKEIKINNKETNKQRRKKKSNKSGNEHTNGTMGCVRIIFVVAEKQNLLHIISTCL